MASPPDYDPLSPLSIFDGQDMSGVWTLAVTDSAFADQGTIVQWCVTIDWI